MKNTQQEKIKNGKQTKIPNNEIIKLQKLIEEYKPDKVNSKKEKT